jgi:hypothetical protein
MLRRIKRDITINVRTSGLRVKYQLLSYLIKLELSRQILEKYSNMKFHENLFSGTQVVPSGLTDGWTDMTKLIIAVRNLRTLVVTPIANCTRGLPVHTFAVYSSLKLSYTILLIVIRAEGFQFVIVTIRYKGAIYLRA